MSRCNVPYTKEQKDFLIKELENSESFLELSELFNKKFGLNKSSSSISCYCRKILKIKLGDIKNKKLIRRTQFKKGCTNNCHFEYQIGEERLKDGYIQVKINNICLRGKSTRKDKKINWKNKKDIVYEKYNGEIPKGEYVIFLDGNRENHNKENLYPISRAINATLNNRGWRFSNAELTKTAIKIVELEQIIKEKYERSSIITRSN